MFEGLGPRLEMVPLDKDPFSAGQTVRFEDDAGEFITESLDALKGCKVSEARISRDAVFFEQISCERLRCLQAGQDLVGPTARSPAAVSSSTMPWLRGSSGPMTANAICASLAKAMIGFRFIVAADSDLCGKGGDAGVIGFHEGKEAGIPARTHESLGDSMLTGAVADEKDMGHRGLLPLLISK